MVDNSTQSVSATKSGTGWTIDVTNCNLVTATTTKDFIVEFSGIVQSNGDFTKDSATQLTYNGSSISSTTVTVYRDTTIARVQEVTYADRITSTLWENEFNRIHRILSETATFIRLDESPPSTDDSKKVATTEWVRDLVGTADSISVLDDIDVDLVAQGKPDGGTNRIVIVQGKTTSDDGKGGIFWWDESDTTTSADNIDVVLVESNSANGRWKRLHQRIETLEINDDLVVEDTLSVTGQTTLTGASTLTGAVSMGSTLSVTGASTLAGAVDLSSTLDVVGASTLGGAVTASSTLNVTGNTTLGNVDIQGTISDSTGTVTVGDNIGITGFLDVGGNSTIDGALTVAGATNLGDVDITGSITDSSGTVTVADDLGITGFLSVTGTTTLTGALTASSASSDFPNGLRIGTSSTLTEYEHGTFTVTNAGDATGVVGGNGGTYVRIGRMVFITCGFHVSTNFTSNKIGGLPFTVADNGFSGSGIETTGVTMANGGSDLLAGVVNATTDVNFLQGNAITTHAPNTTNSPYRVALMYYTTA